jgi:ribonuclease-3
MKTLNRSLRDIEPGLAELEKRIGYAFKDHTLLVAAVTHPSFSVEQTKRLPDNQRLEFLGDAVWQLMVTDLLFNHYPEMPEGKLTRLRSTLSRGDVLVSFARIIGLSDCMLLGKGEDRDGGRLRDSNLEDAFEALIGAIYQDGGRERLVKLCERLVLPMLETRELLLAGENPKGSLQEYTQERFSNIPRYEVISVTGPVHAPEFIVRVWLGEEAIAEAAAGNRREAERRAAALALMILGQRDHSAANGTAVANAPCATPCAESCPGTCPKFCVDILAEDKAIPPLDLELEDDPES